eukprot:m.18431 g.18431  ORF g.18431 m.18431 type:complete len:470 (-) comp8486_c1_seq2:127-1536(-)
MHPTAELHLIRAIYFVQCLVACCISNFLVLYLSSRDLGLHQIGIIIGTVGPVAQLVGQPIWSMLADRTRKHKLVMLTALVCGSMVSFVMLYMNTFLHIALVAGIGGLLLSGVNPLLDNTTLVCLEYHNVPLRHYGRFRVFGALGWGVSAAALGPLIDKFGVQTIFYAFAATTALYVLLIAVLPFRYDFAIGLEDPIDTYHGHPEVHVHHEAGEDDEDRHIILAPSTQAPELVHGMIQAEDEASRLGLLHLPEPLPTYGAIGVEEEERVPSSAGEYLRKLFSREYTLLFFWMVLAMGICKGVIDGFLFLYLQELGAPATLMGMTLLVTTVAEVPFFFFSGELIERYGAIYTVLLALCAYAARLLYYSQLVHPWLVLPIELLHGLTFGLSWAAVASYSFKISPKGYEATTQGITSALFWGLGFGLGACGGGFLNQSYGYIFLFFVTCAFGATACIISMIWYLIERCIRKRQ